MRKLLKRTAALLTVVLVLMGMVQLPASANPLLTSGESYIITRGIGEDPLGPAAPELYKGVTYYGWATLKDESTKELVTGLELAVEAEILNPEGEIVESCRVESNTSYTDTLLEDFSMNQFYLDFTPDMLGTWTFRLTYLDQDGEAFFGPYTVTKECVVPSLRLENWFSSIAMRDNAEIGYAIPGEEAYFNYKLTYRNNGHIMYESVDGFTIGVELYAPDGTHWTPELLYSYRALNSVEMPELTPGTWSVVVTLKGDVNIRATTQLKVLLPGDVNLDGKVDASDAALVLYEAALTGSGQKGEFTDAQNKAGDYDGSGKVDAGDASAILIYAAEAGSGAANG